MTVSREDRTVNHEPDSQPTHRWFKRVATLSGLIMTAFAAVILTISAPFTLHQVVNGQRVALTFAPLTRSWCGPGLITIIGMPLPIQSSSFCSPIRPEITLPAPVTFGASATHGAQKLSTRHSVMPHSESGNDLGASRTSRSKSPEQVITRANARMKTGVHDAASALAQWFIVWSFGPGFVEYLLWCSLSLAAIIMVRLKLTGSTYRSRQVFSFMTVLALVWVAFASVSSGDAASVDRATTIDQIFGASVAKLDVKPTGRIDYTSVAATIGNSVDSTYGGPGAVWPCYQSRASVARILSAMYGVNVRELDCSGATVQHGLLGPQWHPIRHGVVATKPQLDYLMRISGLRIVFVSDGQDELSWSELIGSCYVANSCESKAMAAVFTQSLEAYAITYNELLGALASLPTHPHIVINLSYNPFTPMAQAYGSQCDQTGSLSAGDIQALVRMNNQLNATLVAGARTYGFTVARPVLNPLCNGGPADIQPVFTASGALNPYAYHPLPPGDYAIAVSDYEAARPWIMPTTNGG